MIQREGISIVEEGFKAGCNCTSSETCQYKGCKCLQDLDSDDGDEDEPKSDTPKKIYAYHTHGAKKGLLRRKMLNSKDPIYECHQRCRCSVDCPNRVVERGRRVALQIFHTDTERGWGRLNTKGSGLRSFVHQLTGLGVRSFESIRNGQFVDCYLGEIITSEEANRRREGSQKKDIYLFALDKFTDRNSFDPRLRGDPLEVDGEFLSGPTRFINHSCDPNMRIFARVGDHAEKHVHDLALFAVRDIPRGEELTFDYVDGVNEDEAPAIKAELTECLCGSNQCRGFLW